MSEYAVSPMVLFDSFSIMSIKISFASLASWILFSSIPPQVLHPVWIEQSSLARQHHHPPPEHDACILPEMSVAENTSMSFELFVR